MVTVPTPAADIPRETPIHRSLVRPNLLAGADRELVLINIFTAVALVFGAGPSWVTVGVAALQLTLGQLALVQAAKIDPLFRRVYLRHVRYAAYYPARSSVHARPAPVRGWGSGR